MIETSKDILLVTVAICIIAFTFFSCWGLFYLVGMMRNVFKISKDARTILKKIEEAIDLIKEKIKSSTSYLLLIGEAVKKILEIMSDKGIKFPFKKKKDKDEEYEEEEEEEPRRSKKPKKFKVKGK